MGMPIVYGGSMTEWNLRTAVNRILIGTADENDADQVYRAYYSDRMQELEMIVNRMAPSGVNMDEIMSRCRAMLGM